jgi:hypothetical protein
MKVLLPLAQLVMLMSTSVPCSLAMGLGSSASSAAPNTTTLIDELSDCASTLGDGAGLERASLAVARLFVK